MDELNMESEEGAFTLKNWNSDNDENVHLYADSKNYNKNANSRDKKWLY